MTLAHLSDIHLPPVPMPPLGLFNLKRGLGYLNWLRRRRYQHDAATLAALVSDLERHRPDHIAITGDLVNIALPSEYIAAAAWLAALGAPNAVTAIPGNHDIYVEMGADPGIGRWHANMTDEAASAPQPTFPFVRRRGHLAIIGLNSAVVTPPFHASGRLGPAQLAALDRLLLELGAERRVRVVLIHHPPLPGQAPTRCALLDAPDVSAVLRSRGAELVLHGHNHRAMLAWTAGPIRPIPVVGVPSASMVHPHGDQMLARYNLYRIEPDPAAPITIVEHGITTPGGPVVEVSRHRLEAPSALVA